MKNKRFVSVCIISYLSFSPSWIRIPNPESNPDIYKATESGSNLDPDPQP
jgi:hypothetical protein